MTSGFTYLNISEADDDTMLDSPLTPASLSDELEAELIKDSVIGVCNETEWGCSCNHIDMVVAHIRAYMCVKKQQFGFPPGRTQTGLYKHRIWLEAGNFGFRK